MLELIHVEEESQRIQANVSNMFSSFWMSQFIIPGKNKRQALFMELDGKIHEFYSIIKPELDLRIKINAAERSNMEIYRIYEFETGSKNITGVIGREAKYKMDILADFLNCSPANIFRLTAFEVFTKEKFQYEDETHYNTMKIRHDIIIGQMEQIKKSIAYYWQMMEENYPRIRGPGPK